MISNHRFVQQNERLLDNTKSNNRNRERGRRQRHLAHDSCNADGSSDNGSNDDGNDVVVILERNNKEEDEDKDEVVVVGTRQTMTTKGKCNSNTKSNRNDEAHGDNTSDDDTDDNGVTDLQELMPVLTLPDTQSLMERLGEQNSGWDDYEDDEADKEIKKRSRKAEAE